MPLVVAGDGTGMFEEDFAVHDGNEFELVVLQCAYIQYQEFFA
jgi:hypothetical protein